MCLLHVINKELNIQARTRDRLPKRGAPLQVATAGHQRMVDIPLRAPVSPHPVTHS